MPFSTPVLIAMVFLVCTPLLLALTGIALWQILQLRRDHKLVIANLNQLTEEIRTMATGLTALTTAVTDLTTAVSTETANVNTATAGITEAIKELAASNDPAIAAVAAKIEDQVALINAANRSLAVAASGLPVPPPADSGSGDTQPPPADAPPPPSDETPAPTA